MVAVGGGTILAMGIAMVVLPGPAVLVIPIGLGILATEFVWARRWFQRAKNLTNRHKTRRTASALRTTFRRRWERWRGKLLRLRQRRPRPIPATPTSKRSEAAARTAEVAAGVERNRRG